MNPKIITALLFKLSGYFRKQNHSTEEGTANAMKMMLLIGAEWGRKRLRSKKKEPPAW
jgi:hypothetical protein